MPSWMRANRVYVIQFRRESIRFIAGNRSALAACEWQLFRASYFAGFLRAARWLLRKHNAKQPAAHGFVEFIDLALRGIGIDLVSFGTLGRTDLRQIFFSLFQPLGRAASTNTGTFARSFWVRLLL